MTKQQRTQATEGEIIEKMDWNVRRALSELTQTTTKSDAHMADAVNSLSNLAQQGVVLARHLKARLVQQEALKEVVLKRLEERSFWVKQFKVIKTIDLQDLLEAAYKEKDECPHCDCTKKF